MRQRLLSYVTAVCINLAVVGGIYTPSLARRPAIVRLRERSLLPGGFDRGELAGDGRVIVTVATARRETFTLN